jgi:hypothetical protein
MEDFLIWTWISGHELFVEKQRVFDLNKAITKEFGDLKNVLLTAVSMATMTFQYGRYFWFKVIETQK